MKDTKHRFQKKDALILAVMLLLAFALRLYKINTPLADLHSWRQADTAAVARNFVRHGFDLLRPTYDDLSSLQTGQENPRGYRMVEAPVYNAIFAAFYKVAPFLSLEIWGRLTSVLFSLVTGAIIYYFVLKEVGRLAALSALFVYSVYPFFVFFSRVILPETTALSLTFISLFFLYKFTTVGRKKAALYFVLSFMFLALGLLAKPTVIFFTITSLYLFARKYSFEMFKNPLFYLYFLLAVAPLAWWRYHITFYSEGAPDSLWLIRMVYTFEGIKDIFFRPAFFRWIFFERISNYMLGGFLTVFFALGLITRQKRLFLHALIASSFVYLFVFQGGNVQHEYYQTLILPAVAICVGCGIQFMTSERKKFITPVVVYPLIAAFMILSWYFSYYNVRGYYSYPQELKQIGDIVKTLTAPTDKIVTDRSGDTTLLYLSDRKGSPSPYKSLPEFKREGYAYFVTLHKDVIERTKQEGIHPLLFEEKEKFAIFKL